MSKKDQIFDGMAEKFASNIYGTNKGKLRHILLLEALLPFLGKQNLNILEIGGGTGVMAKALAERGHQVTLTDASADVLAHTHSWAPNFPNLQIRKQSLQEITDIQHYDVTICHAVLEWLADPLAAIDLLYEKMQSDSLLSLSFFNRDAALFSNAIYGNFDYIARGMKVKNQVRLNPTNPLKPSVVIERADKVGFKVLAVTGIRCFHDYLKDKPVDESQFDALLALEQQYNQQAPFCWLGKYLHLMLKKC